MTNYVCMYAIKNDAYFIPFPARFLRFQVPWSDVWSNYDLEEMYHKNAFPYIVQHYQKILLKSSKGYQKNSFPDMMQKYQKISLKYTKRAKKSFSFFFTFFVKDTKNMFPLTWSISTKIPTKIKKSTLKTYL